SRGADGEQVAAGYRRGPLPPESTAAPGIPPLSPNAGKRVKAGKPGSPDVSRTVVGGTGNCRTGRKLIPTCGILWGVAPGGFTDQPPLRALTDFEAKTGRHQDIYHAYHRGTNQVFPTKDEVRIARNAGEERILFLNWKPASGSWAKIAKGDRKVDAYLDRLAAHINKNFPENFFFTVHHEAEDNVREEKGSGYTADDYRAMFRYVVQRLRAKGVDNLVTVWVSMAYVPHTTKKWFESMYPGNDVVDWIGFDTYAYSDPGYGHGDFAELVNRTASNRPVWPGFYNWASTKHPNKPLMVAEWGVWSSKRNPRHKADFYREVGRQIAKFPKIRAMVHFDTPHDQRGRDSRVDATRESLAAYRKLGSLPVFQVQVSTRR
ncbi:MAG TPA: glycosyl hydrolase, partial [Actinoplanes sp.]|nr:glycosyl hydrolase [Actinoplanes sp.]